MVGSIMHSAAEPVANILNTVSTEGGKAPATTCTAVLNKSQRQSITSEHYRNSTQHFLSQLFQTTRKNPRVSQASLVSQVSVAPSQKDQLAASAQRALRAYIVTADTIRTKDHKYVVYKILVTSGLSQWFVHKRFSEFLELHAKLQTQYPTEAKLLPKLPPKRIFFGKFLPSHISSRKDRINKYLSALIDIPILHNEEKVKLFFAEDRNSPVSRPLKVSTVSGATAAQILTQVASVTDDLQGLALQSTDSRSTLSEEKSDSKLFDPSQGIPIFPPRSPKKKIHFFNGSPKKVVPAVVNRKPQMLKRAATRSLLDYNPEEPTSPTFSETPKLRSRSNSSSSDQSPNISQSRLKDKTRFISDSKRVSRSKHANQKVSLEDFVLLKVIGSGSYGKVMLARHKGTGLVLAIKAISKRQLLDQPKEVARVMSERSVLRRTIDHPFLVSLRYSFQTEEKLYFCIDYVNGGELFFHIQRERRFSEERAKFYAAEILLALEYLHSKNIIYRDLKPENCLIDSCGHICIVDFGMAKDMAETSEGRLNSMCGTPEYMAPEVLKEEGYNLTLDWYCYGAILYEMLVGSPPYYSRERSDMFDKILHSRLKFPSTVSPDARDLITRLLERNPSKRLGADGSQSIKDHPFFENINWRSLYNKDIDPPFVPTVTGLFDMTNIDPAFHNQPLPQSVENEGKMSAIPCYAAERLQEEILGLFGGVRDPDLTPSDGPDYNQQFFSSGSRFSLSQHRLPTLDDLTPPSNPSSPPSSKNHKPLTSPLPIAPVTDEEINALSKAFEGFSYVCSNMEDC